MVIRSNRNPSEIILDPLHVCYRYLLSLNLPHPETAQFSLLIACLSNCRSASAGTGVTLEVKSSGLSKIKIAMSLRSV